MYSCKTAHTTFVHHMAVNSSGTLLASGSSDKGVNVFYRPPSEVVTGSWSLCCVLKDHVATVTRVAWCQHREHGSMLATVGADRWIYVYKINVTTQDGKVVGNAVRYSPVRGYEKDVITDVAFVPPRQHQVLLLSTASLDGWVRLYDIQPLQFLCKYTVTQESDICRPLGTRSGGITSTAWFPSSVDETMTLAVGCMNGCFYLYKFCKERNQFKRVYNALPQRIESTIHHIVWAPPVGRCFQLLSLCCRSSVYIVRLNCVSPSVEDYQCEVFVWPHGAVCTAWSHSATLLYLIDDDNPPRVTVLQARDLTDHQSWEKLLSKPTE
ncbi:WD domain, G-beta repeat, putative [Trypanosoma equiperdum]|uniref:Uncharacterized protein n=4 Tax=Trypanozoon TaxID=39700 RepID=Q382F2_TRYB2|nr:hypothetical protein, conserved [Trypanosoma brucei gambiense DAL972]XP_829441.1 hypothetical protein, conserved [Trypanosoma brucei brucei TREU927]RHW68158.1 WD domain [Trypanosoma brucei equiperdum]SCU66250.1 WD domain, G-beta repeat, putative [Trypanosoma equiperdum]EAN80329.1 hypothetical protein, conserved [Trypanosoma brucei brucei TREU927]CBH18428.1 hypothetical protein, conserved [Trypanosoma brucei gambiense DAL972]|eukprot:XP_011780692.1 hypothetical protein, conserved [Trypanosoma brucei gambiense DAL972]